MLYQDGNVRRINEKKRDEIQANHGPIETADIDYWLSGIWDFWLHQKVKAFRQRSTPKTKSLPLKNESPLRCRTTEENPDIEPAPGGKKRCMDEDVAANIPQKRKYVQPMDAIIDEMLTLWLQRGKINIDQLEEWIDRKQIGTQTGGKTNSNHVQTEFTSPTPSTEVEIMQGLKTVSTQDNITSNSSLMGGDNERQGSVCGDSPISSTSLEGKVQVSVN